MNLLQVWDIVFQVSLFGIGLAVLVATWKYVIKRKDEVHNSDEVRT